MSLYAVKSEQFILELQQLGFIDGWKVNTKLGFGKSSIVVSAEKNSRVAAVKIFYPDIVEQYGRDQQMTRIDREKSLIGKKHPNLVEIIGGGVCRASGHIYIAMEKIEGQVLSNVLKDIPLNSIKNLIEQLARAAKYLEDMGIVHRDIKPDNIKISNNLEIISLLDFGVMRPIGDSSATDQHDIRQFVGTRQYSPPEMLYRQEEDTIEGWRSITFYQIGAVLHDMLTGNPLFIDYLNPPARLYNAINTISPEIRRVDADQKLVSLASYCLLKNPTDRLKLVNWKDFFFSDHESIRTVQDRKDRLQRNQSAIRATSKAINFDARETARLSLQDWKRINQNLFDRCNSVLDSLSSSLPLRTVKRIENQHPLATIQYTFDSEPTLGFKTAFHFQISLQTIENSSIVCVYSRAGLGENSNEIGWTKITEDLDDLKNIETPLENWLIEILERLVGPE
jgi:eukaryotic-like serine/threonine-protein kinase